MDNRNLKACVLALAVLFSLLMSVEGLAEAMNQEWKVVTIDGRDYRGTNTYNGWGSFLQQHFQAAFGLQRRTSRGLLAPDESAL